MIDQISELFDLCDDLTIHSDQVKKNSLFVAYPGYKFDGRNYIDSAIKLGAKAILYDLKNFEWKKNWKVPHFGINELKEKLPEIAAEFYGNPSKDLKVIGVTGTNGKTTTVLWISSCLNYLNIKSGFIGTLGYGDHNKIYPTTNTTPDIFTIQKILREFKNNQTHHIAMEVSSHAIDQGRIDGINFNIKLLTNITRDHLDYHKNIKSYIQCKTSFMIGESISHIIINNDDPAGQEVVKKIKDLKNPNFITLGITNDSDLMAKKISYRNNKTLFDLHYDHKIYKIKSSIFGTYNIYNLLGVIACLIKLKIKIQDIQSAVEILSNVEGRAEIIGKNNKKKPNVFIDYAHTPDALENILVTLRQLKPKKLILIFGCGGNRDKGKRREMAIVANKFSDYAIITSDNPRDEKPMDIINDITKYISIPWEKFEKRHEAIEYGLKNMSSNDILLIAGKGHECYQEIQGKKYPFSDKKIALEILRTNKR